MSADEVAKYAYWRLTKNKSVIIPGFLNRPLNTFPAKSTPVLMILILFDGAKFNITSGPNRFKLYSGIG